MFLAVAPNLPVKNLAEFLDLVAANPDRLVWGSDWPHTRHESYISVEGMRRCLDEWVSDPALRERIMGRNALELFRF